MSSHKRPADTDAPAGERKRRASASSEAVAQLYDFCPDVWRLIIDLVDGTGLLALYACSRTCVAPALSSAMCRVSEPYLRDVMMACCFFGSLPAGERVEDLPLFVAQYAILTSATLTDEQRNYIKAAIETYPCALSCLSLAKAGIAPPERPYSMAIPVTTLPADTEIQYMVDQARLGLLDPDAFLFATEDLCRWMAFYNRLIETTGRGTRKLASLTAALDRILHAQLGLGP